MGLISGAQPEFLSQRALSSTKGGGAAGMNQLFTEKI